MKTALFVSANLIGDALYISQAWNEWYKRNQDFERIDLLTLPDHITTLYKDMGVPCNVITAPVAPVEWYDFQHTFDVNKAFALSDAKRQHISQSYADLLGVPLQKDPDGLFLKPIYLPAESNDPRIEENRGAILVSMFSASDASRGNPPQPPNKMLPWPKWIPILKALRGSFPERAIRFLGAPTDRAPAELQIGEEAYLTGVPLNVLAQIMRNCLFLLTVDNGMGHLAASQEAREFVLYPACLGQHYILPWGNKNMAFLQMNPVTVSPAQIVWSLRSITRKWGLV